MKARNVFKVITVKETSRYLVTGLRPFTTYDVQVQSYTATGSGSQPPSHKNGTTKNVPAVTGKLRPNTEFCMELVLVTANQLAQCRTNVREVVASNSSRTNTQGL